MAENKTKATDASVQAFLESVADERRREDCFTLVELMQEVTGEPARMWGETMVGFDSYHYKYASGREGDALLLGFSPRKDSLALYGLIGFDGDAALLGQLGKHKTGKSCLYVKTLKDVDMNVLTDLMKRGARHTREMYPR